MIKDIACNLCGSNSFEKLTLGEPLEKTGNNVICLKCGLIFHNPMMSAQQMDDFYSRQYSGEYSASESISRELARVRLAVLQKHLDLDSISPVLEIGCAQGEFLSELAALNVDCRGVEPAEAMARFGIETYGVDISEGVYEQLPESPDTYGMISLFHVLEHVFDPLATLQRIGRELLPGGYLFLEVPTLGDCQLAMVFKNIHPTTFVRATLEAMLSVAGFEPVMVEEKGYHLRVLAMASPSAARFDFPEVHGIQQRVLSYLSERRTVIEHMLEKLTPLVGRSGGAIYGAGLNTLDLDQVFPLNQLQLDAAFDADPLKQGQEILGLPIKSPAQLKDWSGDYLIISSYAFQEEICEQLSYLTARDVTLVTLYNKESQG